MAMNEGSPDSETERTTALRMLAEARQELRQVLLGLHGAALNYRPLPNTNSIFGSARHAAWVEDYWIGSIVARQPLRHPDTMEDFESHGEDPSDLLFDLDQAAARTDAVLALLQPDDWGAMRERTRANGTVDRFSVRWCVFHTIEHYNEHVGEMTLTRQLWESADRAAVH
ncbi:MAG: hypothetical protein NVS4B8_29660 [Herpetosiphon sp.]